MWKCLTKQLGRHYKRTFSTSKQSNVKVAVIGAAGGIGQPLSLLLKMNPLVKELGLYDLKHTPGIAVDLSHIDTDAMVKGFCGPENMKFALHCSQIVVCVAGMPRKPGMKREDLFKSNASIACEVVQNIAKYCPKALIAIVTNPVNSIVPLAAEILKKANVFDPNKLFGVTTLDVVRSRTFIAEFGSLEPHKIKIPVIGGHSAFTILPVFSNLEPVIRDIDEEEVEELTEKIREGGNVVVQAKGGEGSATLSMAYAAARFVNSLIMGLDGKGNVDIECSFVQSKAHNEVEYFASPLALGKDGIKENLGIPRLNDYEQQLLACLIPQLQKDIEMGLEFAKTIK